MAAIKKGSHADITRRRSSRLASAAITAARDAKLIATVRKEAAAKSKKRPCSDDAVVPRKVARKQYRNKCSADASVGACKNDEANVKAELCTSEGFATFGQGGEVHGRPWAKRTCAIKGCTKG